MKQFIPTLILSILFLFSKAQDINKLQKEAERLEAIPNENSALIKFKEALSFQNSNVHLLYKCSELCSRIGQRQKETKVRDDYYLAAKIYAELALKIDKNSSEANTAMAIVLGRTTLTKSGKEKIIAAKDLKKYVDMAIKNNPSNFLAWHILGRWHYEISNLNFMEKAAVKLFYGSLPYASLKESIIAFEKTKSLSTEFILNYFELAKAYYRNNEKLKAIALLKEMMLIPNHTEDDEPTKTLGKKLLKSWN